MTTVPPSQAEGRIAAPTTSAGVDIGKVLAARKKRLASQITFWSVFAVTGLALAALLLRDTAYDPVQLVSATRPRQDAFSWDLQADRLPPLDPDSPPALFLTSDPEPEVPTPEPTTPVVEPPPGATPKPAAPVLSAEQRKQAVEMVAEGDKLLRARRFQEAEDVYLKAVKIDDALKVPIGLKFYEQGDYWEKRRVWSRAELLYRMSLHFDYRSPKFHRALANTYKALGKGDKAIEHERLAEKFAKEG